MMTSESLKSIEIGAKETAKHTIIWLHGLGADGSDFVPIIPELKLPSAYHVRYIFPHAPIRPITINNGYEMRGWYDIYGLQLQDKLDHAGMLASVEMINELIKQEELRGISTENIILAGFSQGAVIALMTGLSGKKSLAGIIALSGYLPPVENERLSHTTANAKTPIFLAHGTEDPVVPYALGKAAYLSLQHNENPITWRSYPIAHSVSQDEIGDLSQWIQSIWR